MLSQEMLKLGQVRSVIREMFEYGNKRASIIGRENVFDFSLGNPSIPAPKIVDDSIIKLIREEDSVSLHGYTSAPGDPEVRTKIADFLNKKHSSTFSKENVYMTTGAAAALTITLKAISNPGDEIIILAPFFPEYSVFIKNAGANVRIVKCHEDDFQIDINALEKAINKNTKAFIINSPCNPTGVVFSEESLLEVCALLNKKQAEYSNAIFIIADEPYREVVYDGVEVPFIPNIYDNTIISYSFSKSLSLPGERIGYILVSNKCKDSSLVFDAISGAGRSLGYVCASSLFQRVIVNCLGFSSDISAYKYNRDLLYNALQKYGYSIIKPDGAFYLFVKSLDKDATRFCENAKKYELLLVPSDSFGVEGYVRIAYCVSSEMIKKSLPAFEKLANAYKNGEL